MGFKDRRHCPNLCKLASEYIRKSEGCEDDIYAFFEHEQNADSLFVKLVEEFERCILSYFAFHWSLGDLLISQVLRIKCLNILLSYYDLIHNIISVKSFYIVDQS
jgi:hypothetical protein